MEQLINVIIIIIFLLSIIYSFKYKMVQLKLFKNCKEELKNKKSYLAFLLSLGSHIGAGNILGVTTALIVGGPGTLFWMIVCTIFTTIFSLIENTIAMKYRINIDERRGGSPYYILYGLKNKSLSKVFCFFLVLSSTIFFLPIQIKGVSFSLNYIFNFNKIIILIILLFFSYFVIFKGTKTITNFIEKIVPLMTLIFFIVSVFAIIMKINRIDNVMKLILVDAFNFKSCGISVIVVGLKRSLFSNEAGLGTSPSINCLSDTEKPLNQGHLQVLTCFIDTVVMCVMLGFVILLYDMNINQYDGEMLAIAIFSKIFGDFGNILGVFFLFTFSLATVVSGFYGGESNIMFNCINDNNKTRKYKIIYRLLFIGGTIIGIFFNNSGLWLLIDLGLIILGIINIYVILKLQKEFRKEL